MNLNKHKQDIVEICHLLWQKSWVAANDGNVSVRLDDGTYLTTPTGYSKRLINEDMICHLDNEGKMIGQSEYKPSSEFKMHLRCYQQRDDVNAVVHAHPPMSTGFAVANRALDSYSMIETVVTLGSVPVCPFAMPSTEEVPDSLMPYLPYHDAFLLQNHGALTIGCDLQTAYYRMETLELFAQIIINATILGGPQELPRNKIDELINLRKTYGTKGRHPGYKKYPNGNN